ncbi:endonuclease/exonuclease/phosphatase family protein [Streptomyces sp. NPDC051211]|uniref:endonuclease/exonuclease/phosphatase family protein n=1 Tax=Streptomyces sp. NPDC051211 TaxID=3154643 RepID=UPI00344C7926
MTMYLTTREGRARGIGAVGVVVALVLLLNDLVPNRVGNLGSFVQTFLPWSGVIVLLLVGAVLVGARRSKGALAAVLVPAVVWTSLFGPAFFDRAEAARAGDLTVVTHNVDDANPDPEGTARRLVGSGAEIIALEELVQPATRTYERVLAATHPHHAVHGTVGLWSRYPIRDTRPVPIMPWTRALRSTVDTPQGPLTVYVAHLASVRIRPATGFATARRNAAAARLAAELEDAPPGRTLLVGDFNGTTDDRALAPVFSRFRSAQQEAGAGLGFSWPAALPFARIDHILVRGVEPVSAWTLPATASDHLPVAASLRLRTP